MNRSAYKTKVVLTITSDDMSPDTISERLDIVPRSLSYKGVQRSIGLKPAKQNVWSWYCDDVSDANQIEAQLEKLVSTFMPRVDIMKTMAGCAKLTIYIIVEPIKYYPGIVVSPEVIKLCYLTGAGLEVDSYLGTIQKNESGESRSSGDQNSSRN